MASFNAVVLPQPDGPTSATVSPVATESEKPSRTGRPGTKALRTSTYSRAGGVKRLESAHGRILRRGHHRRRPRRLDRRDAPRARRPPRPRPRAREVPALPRRRVAAALLAADLRPARRPRQDPRGRLPGKVRRVLLERGQRHARGRSSSPRRGTRAIRWPTRSSAPSSTTSCCGTPRPAAPRSARRPPSRTCSSRAAARSACACAAPGAGPEEIRAKVVVDASGQGAVLSRKLGLRRFDPKLKRAALFAHYEGIRWPEGSRPGDILLPIDDGVWYWIIPFSDGTCSVGGVFDPAVVRFAEGASVEARYDEMLARSPRMQQLLAGARRISEDPRHLRLLGDLRAPRRRRLGARRRRRGVPRSRVLDRRLPRAGDGRARRADDRPRARAPRPRGRPGLRELRARVQPDVGPLPPLRVQLLRPGLLRGLLHARRPPSASAPPSSRRWPAASSACRPRCGSGRS